MRRFWYRVVEFVAARLSSQLRWKLKHLDPIVGPFYIVCSDCGDTIPAFRDDEGEVVAEYLHLKPWLVHAEGDWGCIELPDGYSPAHDGGHLGGGYRKPRDPT